MSEPRRPEPDQRWSENLHNRLAAVLERVRLRRKFAGQPFDLEEDVNSPSRDSTRTPLVLNVLIAAGAALFALGGLWAWQSWSNRSSEPVDDLLPMFMGSEHDGEAEASEVVAERVAGDKTQVLVPSPEEERIGQVEDSHAGGVAGIIVHVSGSVLRPGVVSLTQGSRVYEALSLAGGATEDADLDRVNLAAPIVDGERIHVPAHGDEGMPTLVPSDRPMSTYSTGLDATPSPLDINRATATQLETLPGIGPSLAQMIMQTREERGPFLAVEELLDIQGIGDAKLALIAPEVTVGP